MSSLLDEAPETTTGAPGVGVARVTGVFGCPGDGTGRMLISPPVLAMVTTTVRRAVLVSVVTEFVEVPYVTMRVVRYVITIVVTSGDDSPPSPPLPIPLGTTGGTVLPPDVATASALLVCCA